MTPNYPEDQIPSTTLQHSWTPTNAETKKAKYEVPVCHVPDVELLLYVIHEFYDVSDNARLHLSQGTEKFAKFRECLRATPRDRWDATLATRTEEGNNNNNNNDFDAAIEAFITKFLTPSCLQIQEEYLLTQYSKKYADIVENMNDRLSKIERLCRRFPEAPDPAFSELKMKNFLFNMMLAQWKNKFRADGHQWGEKTWTRDRLVSWFTSQAELMNERAKERKRKYLPSRHIDPSSSSHPPQPRHHNFPRSHYNPFKQRNINTYNPGRYTNRGFPSRNNFPTHRGPPGRGYHQNGYHQNGHHTSTPHRHNSSTTFGTPRPGRGFPPNHRYTGDRNRYALNGRGNTQTNTSFYNDPYNTNARLPHNSPSATDHFLQDFGNLQHNTLATDAPHGQETNYPPYEEPSYFDHPAPNS